MKQIVNKYKYLIIGLVIIASLILLLFFIYKDDNNSANNINQNSNTVDYSYEVDDILLNGFDLNKEHCIGLICIRNLSLYYSLDSISFINGIVYTNGTSSIDKCVRFTFNNVGNEPFTLDTCFSDVTPNEDFEFELQFDSAEVDIIGIDNYELSEYNN